MVEPEPQIWRVPRVLGPYLAGDRSFLVVSSSNRFADEVECVLVDLVAPVDDEPVSSRCVVFRVDPNDPETNEAPDARWTLSRDGLPMETELSSEYVLSYLVWEITRLAIASGDVDLPIHAAVLERNGRAVVLAGPSYAGKSTLAGWLTAQGWGFLTDEIALVSSMSLQVRPFPRPIGVRRGGPLDPLLSAVPVGDSSRASRRSATGLRSAGRRASAPAGIESLLPASALGRVAGSARVIAIVFVRRTTGDPGPLRQVRPAEALELLVPHLVTIVPEGGVALRRGARLVEAVPSFQLDVGDLVASEAALRLLAETAETTQR